MQPRGSGPSKVKPYWDQTRGAAFYGPPAEYFYGFQYFLKAKRENDNSEETY